MAEVQAPFHSGERQLQHTVGALERMDDIGRRFIRPYMPSQHREFFEQQVLLFVGTADAAGQPWASALAGPPGFVSSPDPRHFAIAGSSLDPACLVPGTKVGALGLQLHTRRRNRVNGTVLSAGAGGAVRVAVDQSFGNCPKYIQVRDIRLDAARLAAFQAASATRASAGAPALAAAPAAQAMHCAGPLGCEQAALVAAADTFFIATCLPGTHASAGAQAPAFVGCDVSHRGGAPGFVSIDGGGGELRWPDYAGNNFFNTLGNILAYPAAGLLFVDWMTGGMLQLTGTAAVDLEDRSLPGAQRAVRFQVKSWVHVPGGLPIRPAPVVERSPYNPRLLTAGPDAPARVRLVRVVAEAEGVKTFEFDAPKAMLDAIAAGRPPFVAGQFASFDFAARSDSGAALVLNRTWTISSHQRETAASGRFCVTVKRAGRVSALLHDAAAPGDEFEFRGVGGSFMLAPDVSRPVLFVAGGIGAALRLGITPIRVMLMQALAEGRRAALVYSVRRPQEAAFLWELAALAAAGDPSAAARDLSDGGDGGSGGGDTTAAAAAAGAAGPRATVVATATRAPASNGAWLGRRGRIDGPMLLEAAGAATLAGWDLYLCGPEAFMADIETLLVACGAEQGHIFTESFSF